MLLLLIAAPVFIVGAAGFRLLQNLTSSHVKITVMCTTGLLMSCYQCNGLFVALLALIINMFLVVAALCRVYIFGGRTGDGTVADNSQLAIFDVCSSSWVTQQQQPRGKGPTPRSSHRTVCYGNSIVLFGGAGDENSTQRLSDMYVLLDGAAAAAAGGGGRGRGLTSCEWVAAGEQAVAGKVGHNGDGYVVCWMHEEHVFCGRTPCLVPEGIRGDESGARALIGNAG